MSPLTKEGEKVLSAMRKNYGTKKGTSVFYATARKRKKSKWFGTAEAKKKHA